MAALIYEPFYDFDRYFESLFNEPHTRLLRLVPQQASDARNTDGVIRAFKPRYQPYLSFSSLLINNANVGP